MKRKFLLLAFLFSFSNSSFSFNVFQRMFNGDHSSTWGKDMVRTFDGGCVITGYVHYSGGPNNPFVMKLDSMGYISWTRIYTGNYHCTSFAIQQTSDSGYVLTGEMYDQGFINSVCFLMKINSSGYLTWFRTYLIDFNQSSSQGTAIFQTIDKGYILAGNMDTSNFKRSFILRADSLGNLIWIRKYHAPSITNNTVTSVLPTIDGNLMLLTVQDSGICLLKTDTNGNVLTNRCFEYGFPFPYQQCFRQMANGDFIVTGKFSNQGVLIKTDSNGDTLWTKKYDIGIGAFDFTTDSGLIMLADDLSMVRTDSSGNIIWSKNYNTFGSPIIPLETVMQNKSGFWALTATGSTWESVYVTNADPLGRICFELNKSVNLIQGLIVTHSDIVLSEPLNFSDSVVSITPAGQGYTDFICTANTPNTLNEPLSTNHFTISPIPFTTIISLHFTFKEKKKACLQIINFTGEIFLKKEILLEDQNLDLSDLKQGIYFIRIVNAETVFTEKIIKN